MEDFRGEGEADAAARSHARILRGPFYSDYRVLMIAPDYSYALIGGSSDDYLWILSRTPKLSNDTLNSILHEAQRRGYNTEELIWVEQSKM